MGHKKGALAALLIVFFSVLLAWLGGYNFDYRNWVVALWTGGTISFASLAYWVFLEIERE
jgi:hypothetical protein